MFRNIDESSTIMTLDFNRWGIIIDNMKCIGKRNNTEFWGDLRLELRRATLKRTSGAAFISYCRGIRRTRRRGQWRSAAGRGNPIHEFGRDRMKRNAADPSTCAQSQGGTLYLFYIHRAMILTSSYEELKQNKITD